MNYDVFLSHNSKDKPLVEQIGQLLTAKYGLRCWLDKWNLIPGEPWQEGLENALDQCETVAVFVGPSEISPWENEEMRSALEIRVANKQRRVIPVLLPDAPEPKELDLPRFLTRLTWVDFRNGLDDKNALYRLYCGIQGISPGIVGDQGGQGKRIKISRGLGRHWRRLGRKRYAWFSVFAIPFLIIAYLWYNGDVDLALFCGGDFSTAPGYVNLATEQRDNGRLACAVQNLQKALIVNPTPTEKAYIYYKLASIYVVSMGPDPVQALDYADLGLQAGPAYQDLLHVTKGIARCQMQQNTDALQEFNLFLELNPDPSSLLAVNVQSILSDLEKGQDMRDVCWVKLGAESLP